MQEDSSLASISPRHLLNPNSYLYKCTKAEKDQNPLAMGGALNTKCISNPPTVQS